MVTLLVFVATELGCSDGGPADSYSRPVATGTAGTAMAVPLFRELTKLTLDLT